MSGEYKLCDSSIQIVGKKLFLLAVVQLPEVQSELDKDISVGVDLGVSLAAVAAVNNSEERLSISNSILKPRLKIQKQLWAMRKALKYTKGGRGRKHKLRRLEALRGKERNFVKTANHKISFDIVQFALKNKAATIFLEDLKGYSERDKSGWVLRNWSYFELQTMIEYKAKKYGIKVVKVSPSWSSQVCHKCGCKGERPTQSEFHCHNDACKVDTINADYNAAKNIAKGGIGLEYTKEQSERIKELEYGSLVAA